MRSPARAVLGICAAMAVVGCGSTRATPASQLAQPRPSVTAADFAFEPPGRAPVAGDGRIPDPTTPTGSAISAPTACAVTFASAQGATAAAVNAWIAAHQDRITDPTVVCLAGTFTSPLHVWGKVSAALLEVAPAPHRTATLDLGTVAAADTDANQYWPDSGGISIVDSRRVEIYGLTVEGYTYDGPGHDPAGIYVTTRSDSPHRSACFDDGGSCGDIYIIGDTVADITNTADEGIGSAVGCGNGDVAAYGIAIIAAGGASSPPLQHVVVEDDTVTGTRTGQSETVAVNGDVTDFLAVGNVIHDVDNIGLDVIGWETGSSQANHGYVADNVVYDVDTLSNAAYGTREHGTCVAGPESAAGIYDDGGSHLWIAGNTVWDTDQGIDLDVETPGRETDHLLVSGNTVHDDPGTSAADPSLGPHPPGQAGTSTVAGHDTYALYIDAFGAGSTIRDVYVHDNTFQNESQFSRQADGGMPVVDLGGRWSDVQLWHDTIEGGGEADRLNPLIQLDSLPASSGGTVIDCNDYGDLSTAADAVDGNFALPNGEWLTLTDWQAANAHAWDAHSAVGGFSPACPTASTP